jgi:hypothetical protein
VQNVEPPRRQDFGEYSATIRHNPMEISLVFALFIG